MKTDYEKERADLSKRDEKIKLLSEVFREHIPDQFKVDKFIYGLMEVGELINEYSGLRADSLISNIREIEKILSESGNKEAILNFKSMSDDYLTTVIFANSNSETSSIIYQMDQSEDLAKVIEC